MARSSHAVSRHVYQLCRQVAESLHLALLDQPIAALRDLLVLEVRPTLSGGPLIVTLQAPADTTAAALVQYQSEVQAAYKELRQAVAQDIHRRKVPELLFQVVTGI